MLRQLALLSLLLPLSISVTACGGAENTLGEVCKTHHSGETFDGVSVEICDSLFSERPYIRPPNDTATTLYVAFEDGGFIDRDGIGYLPVDEQGAPARVLEDAGNRQLIQLYRVEGTLGDKVDPKTNWEKKSIVVKSVTPVLLIAGEAIDSALIGSYEGTISGRIGDRNYDENVRVPFRVTLSKRSDDPKNTMAVWDDPTGALRRADLHRDWQGRQHDDLRPGERREVLGFDTVAR
jgi:hypothetical protein